MQTFNCFSITPIECQSVNISLATLKANGIAILDAKFCPDTKLNIADQNLNKLLHKSSTNANLGISLNATQIKQFSLFLETLSPRNHWLILANWQDLSLTEIIKILPNSDSRKLLLEITNLEQLKLLEASKIKIDGIIAKGSESGGRIGEDSAFVLSQKLLKNTHLPVYVQGGISKNTAAACRAVGAAGVILEEELLLMPESFCPQRWQQHLLSLTGQEAITIGENIAQPIRVLKRPQFSVITELEKLAQKAEKEDNISIWQEATQNLIGWDEPGLKAWPIGQGIGLAQQIRDKYHTTGRFIQAILYETSHNIKLNQQYQPLGVNSPLAQAHNTTYPIVQGPMTRVSDRPLFAQSVSIAGGLPLLALALMNGKQVDEILTETKTLLADKSWGIGILGFVPQSIREEQLAVVKKIKPPFALIAGGRPDQAVELEKQGITTYLHVPNARLLEMFIEQGARNFVFEGRECGGHIGPLSSFVLWESVIDLLLNYISPQVQSEISILFAGGIHDTVSAAMVSTMASPLAEVSIKLGVLMGSAYLFTEEAVTSGAILPQFQQQAIQCTATSNLQTSPGHASRCAMTPFVQEFFATRKQMLAENKTAEEIKNTLESLTLGRLRIASKGIVRQGNTLNQVDEAQQINQGMYMLGQVATMRNQEITIQELHQDVSVGSTELINSLELTSEVKQPQKPSDIAIIGISTLLPQANHPDTFWENILLGVNTITEIPATRWDWRLYYSGDRQERDKVYSKWGGFLSDVPFEPLKFGIPPKSLKSIEPMQLLALEAVRRALVDAGEAYEQGDFDRDKTSVILGGSGGLGDLGQQYATRSEIPRMVNNPDSQVWERLPEWTEESFPGLLMNVTAGRIANRFDLGGSNFTVDAACASSLAAIDLAVQQLETGQANVAIAGGVDTIQSPFGYFCFSKTQALSPLGQVRSFDQAADGIVISEGVAIVILKRLVDAEKDGDRIYAVIKAVASSSDGKGLSLTAPATSGQKKAFLRTYDKAGFSPNTLGLYEAHGTGTVAGDRAELTTISNLLKDNQALPKSCVLGSVKTMIGHTKSTAGVAGLIKVALGLYYQVLPNHLNVENPLPEINAEDSPLYLLKTPQPWITHPDYPRRGAVSAFGFGGTNFHAVLEEYKEDTDKKILGASNWNYELIILSSDNLQNLSQKVNYLTQSLENGGKFRLKDLAYSYAEDATKKENQPFTVSIVVHSLKELQEALKQVSQSLESQSTETLPPHIQLNLLGKKETGKIAFLFPGQVAQYPNMGLGVAFYFPEMREAIAKVTKQLQGKLPKLLTQYIYPPSAYTEEAQEKAKAEISETNITQCCLAAIELGYFDIATRLGLKADLVAGHSYGEYAALMTAGVISREDFVKLSEVRGRVMLKACEAADGAMAVVKATREELSNKIAGMDDVIIANHNAPLQAVISGKTTVVEKVVENLNQLNIMAKMLPVTGAFHSHLIESAQQALHNVISTTPMKSPTITVYSNVTAKPYPNDVDSIKALLSKHLLSMVEFVNQIKAMYDEGARIFLEVGPKHILSNLVNQILEGKEYTTVAMDGQGRGLKGFLIGLGILVSKGVDFDIMNLFEGRDCQKLNLNQLTSYEDKLPKNSWLINGGSVRQQNQTVGYTGTIPPLNQDTIKQKTVVVPKSEKIPPISMPMSKENQESKNFLPNPSINDNFNKKQLSESINKQNSPSLSNQNSQPVMNQQPLAKQSMSQDTKLIAYQSYQETMRQFLKLQEEVMRSFLTGNSTVNSQSVSVSTQNYFPSAIPEETPNISLSNPNIISSPPIQQPSLESKSNIVELNSQEILATTELMTLPTLLEIIVDLVGDRTGYPKEMLGLEQDLEAELGIDSIKRVEILGALQKALPENYANNLKSQMEKMTQIKTLNGLANLILNQSPAEANIINNNGHNKLEIIDANTLRKTLLNLVSERTGYPEEMLGLEQDLEAELGIDSIKRVEILGALPKILPASVAEQIKQEMEELTKIKTLNGLVELLQKFSQTSVGGETNGLGKSEEEAQQASTDTLCDRYVTIAIPKALEGKGQQSLTTTDLTGLFLITEGDKLVTNKLQKLLTEKGAKTAIITTSELENSENIEQKIKQIQQQQGEITGLIHLASFDIYPTPENLETWRKYSQIQSKSLFQILKNCSSDLQKNNGKVIAASLMGGYWGRNKQITPGIALGGSHSGLLKTMMIEWENVLAKVIDFDHNSFNDAASILIQELMNWDNYTEIGYANQERFVFEIVNKPLELQAKLPTSKPEIPQGDWVVLSIGGARGITAEIIKEIIKPNMTLILVGRSAQYIKESAQTEGINDVNILKQILIKQALEKGEKPLPVDIDNQIKKLQRNRAILDNLDLFKQAGVKVEYHGLDVRNDEEFGTFINDIYDKFGKIDAVIQGAGIIQDKLIVDKTLASFEQVFDTKVDSTFILSRYLRPESLKLVVLFTSVAGRTGNRGQADYAAANEVVNRMAWEMSQKWRKTRILALNWGPWNVTGMASEEVNRQFRERGVIPISPNNGRNFFTEELHFGFADEVEIIAGIYQKLPNKSSNNQLNYGNINNFNLPLILTNKVYKLDDNWILEKTITVENEPYLLDHVIKGNPVVPAAVAMELMAEFAQKIWSDWVVKEVRNLRVLKGIILENSQPVTIQLKAKILKENKESLEIVTQIEDLHNRLLYKSEIIMAKQLKTGFANNLKTLETLSGLDIKSAYQKYCFHGRQFQLITSINLFNEEGADAEVEKSNVQKWLNDPNLQNLDQDNINWLFDPGLVDATLQMSLIWTHIYKDKGGLPARFGKITRYDNFKYQKNLNLIFRVTYSDMTSMMFDALYLGDNNKIILEFKDMEVTCTKALKHRKIYELEN